jgi:hypothetical protein
MSSVEAQAQAQTEAQMEAEAQAQAAEEGEISRLARSSALARAARTSGGGVLMRLTAAATVRGGGKGVRGNSWRGFGYEAMVALSDANGPVEAPTPEKRLSMDAIYGQDLSGDIDVEQVSPMIAHNCRMWFAFFLFFSFSLSYVEISMKARPLEVRLTSEPQELILESVPLV